MARLGEPLDEVERRLGDLAPAVVDREGVASARDLHAGGIDVTERQVDDRWLRVPEPEDRTKLVGSDQLRADPGSTKRATNDDGDVAPVAIDLDVGEPEARRRCGRRCVFVSLSVTDRWVVADDTAR